MLWNLACEKVIVKINNVKVSTQCELRWDLTGELVRGEVEYSKVD